MSWLNQLHGNNFRVLFRAFVAVGSLIFAFFYMWNVTFLEEGEKISENGQVVLGFLLSTLLSLLYNFYFGSSENQQITGGDGGGVLETKEEKEEEKE